MICKLCNGDGWITDDNTDLMRCTTKDETVRFYQRLGSQTGRMACPRCQPNWKPREE